MYTYIWGLVFLITLPHWAAAEMPVEFSGYFENTLSLDHNRAESRITALNAAKLRINGERTFGETADVRFGVVGMNYAGDTAIDYRDSLPASVAAAMAPLKERFEDDIWVQELFASLYIQAFTLRLGRQKYYTGTGYGYNPTDLFNQKSVLDPNYETEGIDAIYGEYALADETSIKLFYSFGSGYGKPDREYASFSDGDYQAKIQTAFSSSTVAAAYSNVKKTWVTGELIEWKLYSCEFNSEWHGVGLHGEGGYAVLSQTDPGVGMPKELSDHTRFLLGVDYTFENGFYLIGEYYCEGLGQHDKQDYSVELRLAFLSGALDAIGRHNIFTGGRYDLTDFTTMELYFIINASDPSVIVNPWFRWIASDDINVSLSGQLVSGSTETALGRMGSGLFGRVTFSF